MRTLLLSSALLVSACGMESGHDADSMRANASPATPAIAPAPAPALPSVDSAAKEPAAALTRYLAYASFRGAPSGSDGLSACPPFDTSGDDVDEGWEPDNYVGLVLPRVLDASVSSADTTGRSATGRAEVVRVAEIYRDSLGWAGTLDRQLDTLTFSMQRGPTGWTVCGPATKGADSLGEMAFVITYERAQRTEVNGTRWLPAGITWQAVASHADSVVKAGR
ncbi:MAG TPA: hypothetical protein VFY85_03525 [Gemmatimonadaceae bacterium]|nr:hypothetical protein [Gemmatimonadaceae bacterium]